jgi:hypothetical protein
LNLRGNEIRVLDFLLKTPEGTREGDLARIIPALDQIELFEIGQCRWPMEIRKHSEIFNLVDTANHGSVFLQVDRP